MHTDSVNRKFASEQEMLLESFLHSALGAHSLFTPKLFKRANKVENEPCDLIWFSNGALMLFYLKSGGAKIEKQDSNNLKQIKRWIRLWKKMPNLKLEGVNRLGETSSIELNEIEYCICASVVPHDCGIVFHANTTRDIPGFTCTLPDSLIRNLAASHGTAIDLLSIINDVTDTPRRNFSNHSERSKNNLNLVLKKDRMSSSGYSKTLG